jgi:hypothetical protein
MSIGRERVYGRVIGKRTLRLKTTSFISFTMSTLGTRIGVYNSY